MTHPKGNITYVPQGQFNFNRSYVSELLFHFESHLSYTIADNELTILYSPLPAYRAYLKFRDEFWAYSSNTYSLDFLVEWNYEVFAPGGLESAFTLTVGWEYDILADRHAIGCSTIFPTIHSSYLLPGAGIAAWWGHE